MLIYKHLYDNQLNAELYSLAVKWWSIPILMIDKFK